MKLWNTTAMVVACGTSAALTVALFWGFATGVLAIAFAAIALVIEWTRFAALDRAVSRYEEPRERMNFGLWLILTLVSGLASVATINKQSLDTQSVKPAHEALRWQISDLQKTIAQNQKAIDVFISREMISSKADPRIAENERLRGELVGLQKQLAEMEKQDASRLHALATGVASLTGGAVDKVTWWLVVGFSITLEIVAAWLVWVHAVEGRQKPREARQELLTQNPVPFNPERRSGDLDPLEEQIRHLLFEEKSVPPVQRRLMDTLGVGQQKVKVVLLKLESEGLLEKDARGGFQIRAKE